MIEHTKGRVTMIDDISDYPDTFKSNNNSFHICHKYLSGVGTVQLDQTTLKQKSGRT